MRTSEMSIILEKIKEIEKETESTIKIEGYIDGFIISSYKYGQPLARSVFDENWGIDDCMNELVRFETNALHNAEKLERREMSEEEKILEYLKKLSESNIDEGLDMFYKIKNIENTIVVKMVIFVNTTPILLATIPISMTLAKFNEILSLKLTLAKTPKSITLKKFIRKCKKIIEEMERIRKELE